MFSDRKEAGRLLADRLRYLKGDDPVVVGLPRGGVPVALEVAYALDAPLDVILVRKLGVPFQRELGMGAIGEQDVRVLNHRIVQHARVSDAEIAEVEARERVELTRRTERYRSGRDRIPIDGQVVIVVDDGVATGSTALAACQVARAQGARRVVLAVPVAPRDWVSRMADGPDELVAVQTPRDFSSIGQFYRDFSQTTDAEVVACLDLADRWRVATHLRRADERAPLRDEEVAIVTGGREVSGHLTVPPRASGLVVFAHGSGSSRHSPRNRHVAAVLNRGGLATLLFDLLTPDEEVDRANVFDIELLGARLADVTRNIRKRAELRGLSVGYFGASTGAAAAIRAAAELGAEVAAVVSRGGRPDLAGDHLALVQAPTLLIVGGDDGAVIGLNQTAERALRCASHLEIVPGAGHLFEEPGTLDEVARLAREWFETHFTEARISSRV